MFRSSKYFKEQSILYNPAPVDDFQKLSHSIHQVFYYMYLISDGYAFTGEILLHQNNHLATLSGIGKDYSVSFELFINKFHPNWRSVLHLTPGLKVGENSTRNPGVWIDEKNKLEIQSNVNNQSKFRTKVDDVSICQWIRIEIQQFCKEDKVFINQLVS